MGVGGGHRSEGELTAVGGFVGAVAAVVLGVALPPERDALVVFTHELEGERGPRLMSDVWEAEKNPRRDPVT